MSNKGGRVSPDYLADIAPEYAPYTIKVSDCCFENRATPLAAEGGAHEVGGIVFMQQWLPFILK